MGDLRKFSGKCRQLYARETYYPTSNRSHQAKIICMNAGDVLVYIKDTHDGTACQVKNLRTNRQGFVSKELLVEDKMDCSRPWFFNDITLEMAERYLALAYNIHGSFLVRMSTTSDKHYTISYKDYSLENDRFLIKHCKVAYNKAKNLFKLKQKTYKSLEDFIEHAKKNLILSCRLTNPCLVLRSQHPELSTDAETDDTSLEEIEIIGGLVFQYPVSYFKGKWRGVLDTTIKMVDMIDTKNDEGKSCIWAEMENLSTLNHPNIVKALAITPTQDEADGSTERVLMVLESFDKGSLDHFLLTESYGNFEFEDMILVANQVLDGLIYLKRMNFIHSDLGAHSIFLDSQFRAKIGNFMFARIQSETETRELREFCFTRRTAVETLEDKVFTFYSDVWSFGILLWEMATLGDIPFRGLTLDMIVENVKSKSYKLPMPTEIPGSNQENARKLCQIMTECWHLDVASRPSWENLNCSLKVLSTYP